jgi:hypothetical protein
MSQYKKQTDHQLKENLATAINNKSHHPFVQGRDFFAEQEKLIKNEINNRKENK